MSSNKLIYDKCETNLRLSYNRNMLDWILYDKKYENDKCRVSPQLSSFSVMRSSFPLILVQF